ncbi:MAG: JAB domain-containing protein [Chloroflexi bacterium]|nr:JAB domain-containing protein [Chloroflexota bacterium]
MKVKLLQVRESTGERIGSPRDAYLLLQEEASADRECMWVLHLNIHMEVIEKELVAVGTLDQSLCFPREIFKKAILNSADSIITAHNHPSGWLEPSENDRQVWERLDKAGEILEIKVHDHLIISVKGYYCHRSGQYDYLEADHNK